MLAQFDAAKYEPAGLLISTTARVDLAVKPTVAGPGPEHAGDQMVSVTRNGAIYDYVYAGTGNNELLQHEVGANTYAYTYGREDSHGRPVIEQVNRGGGAQIAYLDNDPLTGQPIQLRTSTGQNLLYIDNGLGQPSCC